MATLPAVLLSSTQKKSGAQLSVEQISFASRVTKSLLIFISFLLIAAVSFVIPPHFIWPLLFLALGISFSLRIFRRNSIITSGEGVCPDCGAPFRILRRPYALPFLDVCERCRREIQVISSVP